eukprot:51902-Chlamydomonas_euryale.AAC.3
MSMGVGYGDMGVGHGDMGASCPPLISHQSPMSPESSSWCAQGPVSGLRCGASSATACPHLAVRVRVRITRNRATEGLLSAARRKGSNSRMGAVTRGAPLRAVLSHVGWLFDSFTGQKGATSLGSQRVFGGVA